TPGGTVLVKDVLPGEEGAAPANLVNVNGTLFFTHRRESGGQSLWKSDGTAAGTTRVKYLTFSYSETTPSGMTVLNGKLYFFCPDDSGNLRIWRSDGTAGGTYPITPAGLEVDGAEIVGLGNNLYFVAGDETYGYELWKSNGTEQGTQLLKDINPGIGNSSPGSLTRLGNRIYFAATHDDSGRELWRSDGTANGTVLVKDIAEYDSSSPGELTDVNGTLFFIAANDAGDYELWKSDGTRAGTQAVKEVSRYYYDAPVALTNVNGTLCFVVSEGNYGTELWRSDGSAAGTTLVADLNRRGDIRNYYYDALPEGLTAVGGTLYFSADDGTHGRELWKYDAAGCQVPADSVEIVGSTVCAGQPASVVLRNTVAGVRYRLVEYFEEGLLGPTVTGTGGDVTITLENLPVDDYTFTVRAFSCTEQTLDGYAYLSVLEPLAAPNANSVLILPGEPVTLYADGGPDEVTYQWYGQAKGGEVLGTGESFDTPPLFAPAVYYVAASHPACGESARTEVKVSLRQRPEGWFVNAGGPTHLSNDEKLFTADHYFRGGRAAAPVWYDIDGTDEDALYQNGRVGAAFSYHFPVPNGTYNVVLHFAETHWPNYEDWNRRKFHVDIEGQRKLTNYNIQERAGGSLTAVRETFRVEVTDGELVVDFKRGAADIPLVAALEVLPAGAELRLNAGGGDYQSVEDKAFVPDAFYRGGQRSAEVDDEIYNTSDDELYRTGRHGSSFDYYLPTGNGTFDVTLHFAETYFGSRVAGGVGSR
ncbi:MAG TPA: ELWxxDGT repeat protein, partial [Cytophagales bacterium]